MYDRVEIILFSLELHEEKIDNNTILHALIYTMFPEYLINYNIENNRLGILYKYYMRH